MFVYLLGASYLGIVNWTVELQKLFDDYLSTGKTENWERLISTLNPGDEVTGVVVARAHFGIWVDIGEGFPALLESIVIDGMDGEMYQKDEYCPVGSSIKAKISGFADRTRQIYLHQKPWPSRSHVSHKHT